MRSAVRLPAVGILVGALLATAGCNSDNDETGAGPRQTQLIILPQNLTVEKGQSLTLSAQAVFADGTDTMVAPEDVTWTSSDTSVATITVRNGVASLNGLLKGNVLVTAEANGLTATTQAGVTPRFVSIRVPPTATDVARALSASLSAFAIFDDSSSQDVSEDAVWTSANPDVATVSGNVVTGATSGATTVTARFRDTEATANVTVDPRLATGITVTGASEIAFGTSTSLSAEAAFDDATTLDVTDGATWTSSNEDIATVDGGVVTPVAPGTVTITAEFQQGSDDPPLAGPFTGTHDVTVKPEDVELATLAIAIADPAIPINTETGLSAVATFTDGSTISASRLTSFSLSNVDPDDAAFHAVIDGRTVTTSAIPGVPLSSYSPGAVEIEGSLTVNGVNKRATAPLTVTAGTPLAVEVTASATTIAVGDAADILVTQPFENPAFTFDITPRATLISSNAAVLAVDDTSSSVVGLTAGTADVSAFVDGESVGSVSITVQ